MTYMKTILIGTAGLAATLALAAPASAQGYPYGYGQQNSGGLLGAIINSVTGGYGQYPQGNYGYGQIDQRSAVNQCAAAAEQRINASYRGQGYGAANGYNGSQNGYGYQNGYAAQGNGRVLGITSVQRKSKGGLKVRGVATSGAYGNQSYDGQYGNQGYGNPYGNNGYQNGYGNQYGANAAADLSFSCNVTQRGQVVDVRIARNQDAYRRGY